MTGNKPTATQERQLKRWLDKWRSRLFLHEWFVHFDYPEVCPDAHGSDLECLAEVSVDTVYKQMKIKIKIYAAFFKKSLKIQEHALVHELCHAHTQELWDIASSLRNGVMYHDYQIRDSVETLTQRMSIIAFRDEWSPNAKT